MCVNVKNRSAYPRTKSQDFVTYVAYGTKEVKSKVFCFYGNYSKGSRRKRVEGIAEREKGRETSSVPSDFPHINYSR